MSENLLTCFAYLIAYGIPAHLALSEAFVALTAWCYRESSK